MTVQLDEEKHYVNSVPLTSGNVLIHRPEGIDFQGVSWPAYSYYSSDVYYDTGDSTYKSCLIVRKGRSDMTQAYVQLVGDGAFILHKEIPCDYVYELLRSNLEFEFVPSTILAPWGGKEHEQFMSRVKELKYVSVDAQVNLVNFLLELKELKMFYPNLRKTIRNLKKLLRHKGNSWSSTLAKTNKLQTLGDVVSSGYLEFAYGAGAFVRDVLSLWQTFSNFEKKYKGFISGMGVRKSSYNRDNPVYPVPPNQRFNRLIEGVDCEVQVNYQWLNDPYSCVSSQYRYFSQAMSQWDSRTLFALEKLGTVPDPAIIWNAIPLSFILDWVYPVGEWLSKRKYDMVDVNIVIDGGGFGAASTLVRDILIRKRGVASAPWQYVTSQTWWTRQRTAMSLETWPVKSLQFQGCTLRKAASASSLLFQAYIAKGKRR
jgi:hypothetical protein